MTRSASHREADAAAVRAIAQAAINVELFTIPLYLVAAYSIQGMHQITGKNNSFYAGRRWPGPATTANPQTANEHAFNLLFAVFCEEMLHLQLAANVASALGVTPTFTSLALQDSCYGWHCYGPDKTAIPHIVDLADTTHAGTKVMLSAVTAQQVTLFRIIEESAVTARQHHLDPDKYFPTVPFQNWVADNTEVDLPMFGSVDWMYQCFYEYLTLVYDDDTTLWEHVFTPGSVQNDLFNDEKDGHPAREYQFKTTITTENPTAALSQVLTMFNAITDQGEGSTMSTRLEPDEINVVDARFQADRNALEIDYPRFTDTGALGPSADAHARHCWGQIDHYECFHQLATLVPNVITWPMWHAARPDGWQAQDLISTQQNIPGLPSAAQVADALNQCAGATTAQTMHQVLSIASVGALAGIDVALNTYWAKANTPFPDAAMMGSGDRIAACWAILGRAPDLSVGMPNSHSAAHACQSLSLATPGNTCAATSMYHTCRGSNSCRGQGGCGFVQQLPTGTPSGVTTVKTKTPPVVNEHTLFSAPSVNTCAGLGGCAVPISASQVFHSTGTMAIYDGDDQIDTLEFTQGELVSDVAYRAYLLVANHRVIKVPKTPSQANALRLAFPPST